MIRLVSISVSVLAIAAPAFAGTLVALRPAPVAATGAVTIADVFDGATGPAAQTVLAPAPGPGMNAVLDAGRVQLAVERAGFDWTNDQAVRRIIVASGAAPAGPGRTREGAARPGRRAQVLAWARNVNAGDIIQASDLVWSDEAIAGAGAPADPDEVIGKAAKSPLRVGAAVQARDLAEPLVVHRNETISVAYDAGGIRLVLQAKALKDASVGESVQVLNPQSKKVIEAVASGPGKAVVGPRADALKAAPFATASLR
jgi:flagella basal body P-ring formation protein FlgA